MSENAVDFLLSTTTEIIDEVAYEIKNFAVALATEIPTLPNVKIPKVKMPKVNLPDINLPDINVPTLPSLEELIMDQFPDINIQSITIPKVNFSCSFKNPINIVKDKMDIMTEKLTYGFNLIKSNFDNIKNNFPSSDDFNKLFKKLFTKC
jgi:hypothetical protein